MLLLTWNSKPHESDSKLLKEFSQCEHTQVTNPQPAQGIRDKAQNLQGSQLRYPTLSCKPSVTPSFLSDTLCRFPWMESRPWDRFSEWSFTGREGSREVVYHWLEGHALSCGSTS